VAGHSIFRFHLPPHACWTFQPPLSQGSQIPASVCQTEPTPRNESSKLTKELKQWKAENNETESNHFQP